MKLKFGIPEATRSMFREYRFPFFDYSPISHSEDPCLAWTTQSAEMSFSMFLDSLKLYLSEYLQSGKYLPKFPTNVIMQFSVRVGCASLKKG